MTVFQIPARDIRGPHTQYLYPWSDIGGVGRGLKGEPANSASKWAGKQANKQTKKQKEGWGHGVSVKRGTDICGWRMRIGKCG